jgi:hypothetical protein
VILIPDLHQRFDFHPATTEEKKNAHASARRILLRAASDVLHKMPTGSGREAALFVTNMEQAMFWANAGMARHGGE